MYVCHLLCFHPFPTLHEDDADALEALKHLAPGRTLRRLLQLVGHGCPGRGFALADALHTRQSN